MDTDILNIPPQVWEDSRSVSEGSLSTSSEQLALIGFAYQLSSIIASNDGIADEIDVRKEAKLLMSLSCSPPTTTTTTIEEQSGRITPSSDSSSCHSNGSGRASFCFTCPSLSLENHSQGLEGDFLPTKLKAGESSPSVLLGRSLKVDDRDALRLSSEAMGRNIMQSYRKALDWRIQSWEDSLSRILVDKERDLIEQNASEEEIRELLKSRETNLLLALRESKQKIKVIHASTSFKVLPQRVTKADGSEPPAKKQRTETEASGLEETEYQYHVAHVMSLEGFLYIHTPAGYVKIELQVPGSMTGVFLTTEEDVEELTNVKIELNTEILASMIEKSSRSVVRASVEAVLKGEAEEEKEGKGGSPVKLHAPQPIVSASTPKREVSEDRVSGLVVITPARDTSSPSSYGDSDNDDKSLLLSIPDNFTSDSSEQSFRMLTPQPSRLRDMGNFTFTSQSKRKTSLPTVVTPHKTQWPEAISSGKGPILPLLVEAACAAMRKN
jgi:hypothetical protein